jgi:hypothetical protein
MNSEVMKVYHIGRRGRPVRMIVAGDLTDPYRRSPWRRIVTLWNEIVDVARETRELETQLLGRGHYRRIGES